MSICDNGDVLSVLYIIKIILTLIRVVVPILLLLSLTIEYMKASHSGDSDALAKANKMVVTRIIAAILVFFIPNFVNLIVDITDPNEKAKIDGIVKDKIKKAVE